MTINIKTEQEIQKMRVAGRLAAEVFGNDSPLCQSGRDNRRTQHDLP